MLSLFRAFRHTLIGLFSTLILISTTVGCLSPVSPDTIKDRILLSEAQKLLPFQVCLPGYIPEGIVISDTVRYHDEFGDSYESDVTIDYIDVDSGNIVFTIFQQHGPGVRSDFQNITTQRISLRRLMAWQVEWVTTDDFENQIDELDKNGIVEYKVYTSDIERLIVEIKSPKKLEAILITWPLNKFVLIDIYSYLSVDETKNIANSILNCNLIQSETP